MLRVVAVFCTPRLLTTDWVPGVYTEEVRNPQGGRSVSNMLHTFLPINAHKLSVDSSHTPALGF